MATRPTHATVASFAMDPDRVDDQDRALNEMIVPGVRSAPGFVAGYWTRDPSTHESHVMLLFDSESAAQAMATGVRANAESQTAVGVTLKSIVVTEVRAHAEGVS